MKLLALSLTLAASSMAMADVTFVPGYTFVSMSDDGRTAAGWSGARSAVWTRDGGPVVFGNEAALGAANRATAISGNGAVIAGFVARNMPTPDTLYRWSGPGSAQTLGNYANASEVRANGVSMGGNTIVGTSRMFQNTDYAAFIWTPGGGFRSLAGVGHLSEAVAVTDDGSTVAGWRVTSSGAEAYLWSESTGVQILPTLGRGLAASSAAMSGDGRFVVGNVADGPIQSQACLWDHGEIIGLGYLPGYLNSRARSVSDDGLIVTGLADTIIGPAVEPAFVWSTETGMVGFSSYMALRGVDLPTAYRYEDIRVSGDGRTFYGFFNDLHGLSGTFFATVPAPGPITMLVATYFVMPGALWRRRNV